jgi:hypothetical protein
MYFKIITGHDTVEANNTRLSDVIFMIFEDTYWIIRPMISFWTRKIDEKI